MHNEPFSPVCFFRFFRSKRYKALKHDYEVGWYWTIWLKLAMCGGYLPLDSDLWTVAGADTKHFFEKDSACVLACFETRKVDGRVEIYSETLIHSLQVAEKLRLAANGVEKPPPKRPIYKGSRFVKPSVENVKSYCEERRNGIDPEQFVNFYSAKGWKIGKSPMKDWRAAVRTWEKNSALPDVCSNPDHHGRTNRGNCWDCGKRKA